MFYLNAYNIGIFILFFTYVSNKKTSRNYNDLSDFNSDVYLNSLQLIDKYGYNSEKHKVTTEDGYIVNLFRMASKGPPVLLVHGIGDSSDSWLLLGPASSLAYQLADDGFDVWLFNSRGNRYSKGNTRNLTDREYWNFSYEEMGLRDIPASIDYILEKTFEKKITYVGYSQGTTTFLVMCSLRPEYNDKINHAVLLAPVAWVNTIKYPFIEMLSKQLDFLIELFDNSGRYELFTDNARKNTGLICRDTLPEIIICNIEYYLNYGLSNLKNLDLDKFDVIDNHIPAGVSTKTFAHFIQGHKFKQFQRFDYGSKKNFRLYSSLQPPNYDLSLVKIPVSLLVSESDWISDMEDVEILKSKLPNLQRFMVIKKDLDFTHIEFMYGSRVKKLVNNPVRKILLKEIGDRILK